MKHLIDVLEESAKRNGPNYVLTIGHLLNIVKMSEEWRERSEEAEDYRNDMIYAEIAATDM
jgi:hypothetical protein